jgi:hypothetical protein
MRAGTGGRTAGSRRSELPLAIASNSAPAAPFRRVARRKRRALGCVVSWQRHPRACAAPVSARVRSSRACRGDRARDGWAPAAPSTSGTAHVSAVRALATAGAPRREALAASASQSASAARSGNGCMAARSAASCPPAIRHGPCAGQCAGQSVQRWGRERTRDLFCRRAPAMMSSTSLAVLRRRLPASSSAPPAGARLSPASAVCWQQMTAAVRSCLRACPHARRPGCSAGRGCASPAAPGHAIMSRTTQPRPARMGHGHVAPVAACTRITAMLFHERPCLASPFTREPGTASRGKPCSYKPGFSRRSPQPAAARTVKG